MLLAVAAAIVVFAAIVGAIARGVNQSRARSLANARLDHAVGASGIIVGAEPLHLAGTGDRGLLLIHGFNDTPQSVAQLARALNKQGWTVHVPLLPHHGRGGDELASDGNADEWINAARIEWQLLRNRVPRAALSGQSMGGAIAVILASEAEPTALVLLAPYLTMGKLTSALASLWPLWQLVVPKLFTDPQRGLYDRVARANALGSWWFTPRLVHELKRVVKRARRAVSDVRAPTLVIHARSDYRIPSRSAMRAFEMLRMADKTLQWSERGGHVLAADSGRDAVIADAAVWLNAKMPPR